MSSPPSVPRSGDPLPWEEDPADAAAPPPWEQDPPASAPAPAASRPRHDAFDESRRRAFLRALAKTGGILDAARTVGVAPRSVYRHQENDAVFAEHCRLAIAMAATPVELLAFQRAVEGVDHAFACGGEVHVRRHYSDGLLRLLLQATNPKKYGRNPGFSRKRMLRHERKAMMREVRAEVASEGFQQPIEQVRQTILDRLDALEVRDRAERLAAGWTRTPDGHMLPPGYGPIPGHPALAAPAPARELAERDSRDDGAAEPASRAARHAEPETEDTPRITV